MQRSYLPTIRNNLLVQPSRVEGRVTLEYVAFSVSRNVGKKLSVYAAQRPIKLKISNKILSLELGNDGLLFKPVFPKFYSSTPFGFEK